MFQRFSRWGCHPRAGLALFWGVTMGACTAGTRVESTIGGGGFPPTRCRRRRCSPAREYAAAYSIAGMRTLTLSPPATGKDGEDPPLLPGQPIKCG